MLEIKDIKEYNFGYNNGLRTMWQANHDSNGNNTTFNHELLVQAQNELIKESLDYQKGFQTGYQDYLDFTTDEIKILGNQILGRSRKI